MSKNPVFIINEPPKGGGIGCRGLSARGNEMGLETIQLSSPAAPAGCLPIIPQELGHREQQREAAPPKVEVHVSACRGSTSLPLTPPPHAPFDPLGGRRAIGEISRECAASDKRLNGAPPNATARPEHLTAKAVATKPHPHPQNPVLKLEQPAHVHMSEKHRT